MPRRYFCGVGAPLQIGDQRPQRGEPLDEPRPRPAEERLRDGHHPPLLHEAQALPARPSEHDLGPIMGEGHPAPGDDHRVRRERHGVFVVQRRALDVAVAERVLGASGEQEVIHPASAPGGDDRLRPPLDEDARGPGGGGAGDGADGREQRLGERAGPLGHAEGGTDREDVLGGVGDGPGREGEQGEATGLEGGHHVLVAGDGERGEHEVRAQRGDLLRVYREVLADAGEGSHHVRREVGVLVHPDEEVGAAERADDLGVGAGEGHDAHGSSEGRG